MKQSILQNLLGHCG